MQMGSVILLVIGPKVEIQQAEDEDATVFMPMAPLAKTGKTPAAGAAAAAVSAPVQASEVPPAKSGSAGKLLVGLLLLVVAAAAVWAFRTQF